MSYAKLVSRAFAGLIVFDKLARNVDMTGTPLLILSAVMVITTVQFILMGLIAELLVRTYHESQNRPTYVIKEVLESTDDSGDRP